MKGFPNAPTVFLKLGLLTFASLLAVLPARGTTGTAIDINVNTIGPYSDLSRSGAWGVAGNGGVENSWIMQPLTPQSITCVYVANNNPTNAHAFTLTFRSTGDPRILGFLSQPVAIQNKWKSVSVISDTVSAGMVGSYSFSTPAAARAQIQITGTATAGGSPDTADVYIVQSASDCGTAIINVSRNVICNSQASAQIASGTTSLLVALPARGQFIHVCSWSVAGSVTTTAEFSFNNGTAGNCTVNGAIVWDTAQATGNSPIMLSGGPSQVFQTTVTSQPLCGTNFGTGSTSYVSVSYAVF